MLLVSNFICGVVISKIGGKTSVRGNDMYDFMRNKYRPLSSKKNAQRYHYGRATS